jgi:hypothetical protein
MERRFKVIADLQSLPSLPSKPYATAKSVNRVGKGLEEMLIIQHGLRDFPLPRERRPARRGSAKKRRAGEGLELGEIYVGIKAPHPVLRTTFSPRRRDLVAIQCDQKKL